MTRSTRRKALVGALSALTAAVTAALAVGLTKSSGSHAVRGRTVAAARPAYVAPPDGGGGLFATLTTPSPFAALFAPSTTSTQVTSVRPNTTYTVRCYRNGTAIRAIGGATSSPTWVLLADPAGNTVGYVPAVGLNLAPSVIVAQAPACTVEAPPSAPPTTQPPPQPTPTPTDGSATRPGEWPFTPPLLPGGPDQRDGRSDCLLNQPLALFNSRVVRNGAGWIEYTAGPGGRAGTATACLERTHVNGTPANNGRIAAAMAAAQARAVSHNADTDPPAAWATPRTRDVAACHLIAASLGGDGDEPRNLVPCWQNPTNNPGMEVPEKEVLNYANNTTLGQAVYYVVTPHYNGNASTIPTSITMVAYLQEPGTRPPGKEVVFEISPNEKAIATAGGHQIVINLGN